MNATPPMTAIVRGRSGRSKQGVEKYDFSKNAIPSILELNAITRSCNTLFLLDVNPFFVIYGFALELRLTTQAVYAITVNVEGIFYIYVQKGIC